MKAVGFYQSLPITDINSLIDLDIELPKLEGKHDILVKVEAVSVNPVDYKVRLKSLVNVNSKPRVLGWDVAGVVLESRSDDFKVGDRVYYAGDITKPGGNSEYHVIDSRVVGHISNKMSFIEAASLPLTSLTAWESLFERLDVVKDKQKTILIINGAGGVGSIAIQLAKHLTELKIITTASRPQSIQWCKDMGADYIINHYEDLVSQVHDLGFKYVDYILILNHTDQYIKACGELIVPFGKVCTIVETETGELNIAPLKSKSASLIQEFMFTHTMYKTDDMNKQGIILNIISKLYQDGIIKPTVNMHLSPINAKNLRQAHMLLEKGKSVGKIILSGF